MGDMREMKVCPAPYFVYSRCQADAWDLPMSELMSLKCPLLLDRNTTSLAFNATFFACSRLDISLKVLVHRAQATN